MINAVESVTSIVTADRTRWTTLRFDQIATSITDRVNDPAEAGVDYYVGLEHLDPESLKIRRWGAPTDVEATKLRFQPGDIIFGRRRAYQRKLAVAEFAGICSAHALVLRPRTETVVPEFLPFFMQSEVFFDRAIAISVGSLSPTINWKTLAQQAFPIPPKGEQHRIAEILSAIDMTVEAISTGETSQVRLAEALLQMFLTTSLQRNQHDLRISELGSIPSDYRVLSCADLISEPPQNGYSPPSTDAGRGLPTLSIGAVREGRVIAKGNIKFGEIPSEKLERFRLHRGDLLVVRGNGNKNLVGRCGIVDDVPDNCFYPDLLIRLKFDETRLRSPFAALQWNSPHTHQRLVARAKSTNGIWKVNGQDLRQHRLVVPPVPEQDEFLKIIEPVEHGIALGRQHQRRLSGLRKQLTNFLLGPGPS